DFWQTDYDAVSNTWQITYNLPLDSLNDVPQDVEFRIKYLQTHITDLNYDGRIDNKDYCILANDWSDEISPVDIAPQPFGDGKVDFMDLAFFVEYWLTATTIPPLPTKASNPSPVDNATGVSTTTADLGWTAGSDAESHDVYFGTADPPPFIGNQTETTFGPGTMALATTHYWRIDSVNGWGKTEGTVWSFRTIGGGPGFPGPASNPSPADNAKGVSITATDLDWTAGSNATSHDVYFGTNNPPPFIQNQAGTTFDPDTMDYITTYYWRVDEVNAYGKFTGVVWSFTTTGAGPG
ncbi:MAG: hypothetical protein ACYSUY_10075, partial [Planctomycetota bacterium]